MVCCMGAPVPGRWIGEDRQQGRFLTARRLRAAQSCRVNAKKQMRRCDKLANNLVGNLSDSRAKAAKKNFRRADPTGNSAFRFRPLSGLFAWSFAISSEPVCLLTASGPF